MAVEVSYKILFKQKDSSLLSTIVHRVLELVLMSLERILRKLPYAHGHLEVEARQGGGEIILSMSVSLTPALTLPTLDMLLLCSDSRRDEYRFHTHRLTPMPHTS